MAQLVGVGVDNTFRRKFDKEEYLQRARERKEKELEGLSKSNSKGRPVQRKPLKNRDCEVYLDSRLGKSQVVNPIAPLGQQAGYFCSVCECVVKDSANYLDHINGKKHQRGLRMSMRVERASLQQVRQRFENHLKKRKDPGTFTEQDLDEQILKQQQKEEETKRQKRERKKEKKKEKAIEEEIKVDPELAAMIGFGCFGRS